MRGPLAPPLSCQKNLKTNTWKNGTWKNGTWKNGTWKNSTWKNSEGLLPPVIK
ncbi:hypothetical protein H3V17_00535 [Bartonella sp. M0283]|uniref:hypothetical protein n=1 Tax=Bartonella sp. M0283 TaxID=2751016 RepID=UPI0018DDCDFB|nr:hypothetical protein [Bartonella sp. M0283]MBI0162140.1 hypothetical protein [Bartonella sp. M0283]